MFVVYNSLSGFLNFLKIQYTIPPTILTCPYAILDPKKIKH